MIYIDIHRQRLSKNWADIFRFVLSSWENYREPTVNYRSFSLNICLFCIF